MFDDFSRGGSQDGRRFGASLLLAALAFGLVAGSLVVASAAVRSGPPEEELVQVEFAPPPEPEPEPEPPPPQPEPPPPEPERPEPRPRVQRDELVQPEEISDEELEESDDALVDDDGTGGPVDGFLDGTRGGTGTAPAPEPEPEPEPPPPPPRPRGPVMRPENATGGDMIGGMPPITYPPGARASGVQGMVIIKCAIDLEGVPQRCTVLRGAEPLHAAALANVRARRFTPVRLPDGTPIEVWKIFPVRFQLTNM